MFVSMTVILIVLGIFGIVEEAGARPTKGGDFEKVMEHISKIAAEMGVPHVWVCHAIVLF